MGSQPNHAKRGLSGKINRQSMQKELEALEREYRVGWREFEIGELFEISPTKSYGMTNDELRKNVGETLVVSNTSYQNGTFMKSSLEATEKANQITFSDTTTDEGIFFQPYEFIGYSHVQKMAPKFIDELSKRLGFYFVSAIRKSVKGKYDYGTKMNRTSMSKEKITLPISADRKIAFAYIEKFVETLEAERLAALEAYLQATGLKNTELSSAEAGAIEALDRVKWKEFKIDKLFNVYPSKSYSGLNDDKILDQKGKTPYVSNQSQNNGYIGWSNLEHLNDNNVITLSDTWQSERTIFYQPKAFIGKSHLQVMSPYSDKFDKYIAWFIISSFRKSILGMNYDYGTKFNREKIKATKIQLPVSADGKIDYDFMSNLTKAMQKIVIKGVVAFADERLKVTKGVVGND